MIRVYFKDDGQDCLWWEIDAEGNVTDADMQGWVWIGTKVDIKQPIKEGAPLYVTFKDSVSGIWKHPVIKVEKNVNIHT